MEPVKNYRKDNQKQVMAEPKPAAVITVRGEEFFLIDLENAWTWEMNQMVKPFVSLMLKKYIGAVELNKLAASSMSDVKKQIAEDLNISQVLDITFDIEEQINPLEFLALMYWNKGEDEFNKDTYKERIKKFEKITDAEFEKAKVALDYFFTGKLPSIVQNTQIFFKAIQAMRGIQT